MIRQDLITGLRRLFVAGTTFSGLVRYIIEQHPGERVTASTVREALMEAFAIAFHEPVKMDVAAPTNDDNYSAVTAFLIPEILATRLRWLSDATLPGSEPTWLDNLPVTEVGQFYQSLKDKPLSGISEEGWVALSLADRERLYRMEVGNSVLWERVLVLARLAEQLQRRSSEVRPSGP